VSRVIALRATIGLCSETTTMWFDFIKFTHNHGVGVRTRKPMRKSATRTASSVASTKGWDGSGLGSDVKLCWSTRCEKVGDDMDDVEMMKDREDGDDVEFS
jgi:hypothetical protein